MIKFGKTSVTLIAMLALSGCGGGSASPSSVQALSALAPTPTPTPTHTTAAAPPAGYIVAESLEGAPDLVASFDIGNGLRPSWGTGEIPEAYTADGSEGAFRFTCGGDGQISYDDPLVYSGQPGASHLHQVWGSEEFDADTTPESLAATAETNCNSTPFSLNRSSYWMPTLVNDQGQAIQPDLVSVYYKRATSSSRFCDPENAAFIGTCIGLPNQIRFIFGWDSNNPTAEVRGASWYCTGGDGRHYSNLDDVFASGCRAGDLLVANTVGPDCWDGKYLDSPDHRSHMAYSDYSRGDGLRHCPSSHPYYIPQEENKAQWTVTADMIAADGASRIFLSSDAMLPGARPGETLHADYIESWVGSAKKLWLDNCIERALSCAGGDLGNGQQLIGASQPSYGWVNPSPRVAIPERPGA